MSLSVEEMNKQLPVANMLPGEAVPYYMASGEGARYEINGQLVTVIARAADTGGIFSAAYVSGGMGAESPFVSHSIEHKTLYVFDGILHVWLPGESRILTPGDSVVIPPNTPHAYRMASHCTRFLNWMTPGGGEKYYERVGTPIDSHVPPVRPGHQASRQEQAELGAEFGITFPDVERVPSSFKHDAGLPPTQSPYFLSAGEGERMVSYQTMFTYLSRPANTGSNYFAVHTKGAKSPYIPLHFHSQHTENFLCTEGRMWLYANGREMLLTKGDFVHAPAGTIHSFALDAHNTQMVGFLTPSVFNGFFEYFNEPTEDYMYTEGGEPYMDMEGFGRAQAEMDLTVVGPPPQRRAALDIP